MTLAEQLYGMMQRSMEASQLTDLCTGTVTSAVPLEITLSTSMAPLRASVLALTANVVEKKIPALSHTHTADGAATSSALEDVVCVENGEALPVSGGYILLNRALAVGDKVLMFRTQHGQKYLVLSRIYEVP